MARWGKREQPIDRAVRELESQLAQVRRQLRQAEPPDATAASSTRTGAVPETAGSDTVGRFVKQLLGPSGQRPVAAYRPRQDLFEVVATPLAQLESEPIAFGENRDPDLFTTAAPGADVQSGAAQARIETASEADRQANQGSKLVHYLSAGSIRSYKPLRRVQREERNRFFAWLGLAAGALWLIYVIVR